MLQKRGKLIVIEGGDGSGKGTQSDLLTQYLKKHEISYAFVDFPNYDSFYGQMIAQFLRGEYGSLETVSPYLASLLYALDRRDARQTIKEHLDRGRIVVSNRYVTSNIAHQGSKIGDEQKRLDFIAWCEKLEYGLNQMPKEDIVVYLKVPVVKTGALLHEKGDRAYLNGKKIDIHEQDRAYQKRTEELYNHLAQTKKSWVTIECFKHGTMLSREDISHKIIQTLQENDIF